jgi:uncharacterized membrane protein YphA (DoxX/SURF4 family)
MTSFARGSLGLGLLILRLTVTVDIVAIASRYPVSSMIAVNVMGIAALSFFLTAGLFTSFAACFAGTVMFVFYAIPLRDGAGIPALSIGLMCIVLALSGPGAYSVDALLWGPKRITLP